MGWPASAGGNSAGSLVIVVPTKPAPASEESPVPKMVSASPVATWFAPSVSASAAKRSEAQRPASPATA